MAVEGVVVLTLRTSRASPFGRKICIALAVLGMDPEVRIQLADTADPTDSLRLQNPLGKIPTLVLEDGTALFDSRVILEYLNVRHGGRALIPDGPDRVRVLQQQALADGILDAAVLIVYEARFREKALHSSAWLDHQHGKIERALAHAAQFHVGGGCDPAHVGSIAQAVALGYLDLRFDGAWRRAHPRLVAWLDDFSCTIPSYVETAPS